MKPKGESNEKGKAPEGLLDPSNCSGSEVGIDTVTKTKSITQRLDSTLRKQFSKCLVQKQEEQRIRSLVLFCAHCDLRFEAKPLAGSKPNSQFFSHECSVEKKMIRRKLYGLSTPQCAVQHDGACFVLYTERAKKRTPFKRACMSKFDPARNYMPTAKMMFLSNHGYMKSAELLGSKSKSRSTRVSPVKNYPLNKLTTSRLKISNAGSSEDLLNQLSSIQETLSMKTPLRAFRKDNCSSIASDNLEEPIEIEFSETRKEAIPSIRRCRY